jgi:geranylgeranyl pyrophosphate synthase
MEVIRRKTAVLFQGACRISALIADASREKEAALSGYGYNLGLAFQMADDLLDYTVDSTVLGKEVGADLKEGKLTLPVIYALSAASVQDRDRMVNNTEVLLIRKIWQPAISNAPKKHYLYLNHQRPGRLCWMLLIIHWLAGSDCGMG